MVCTGYSEDVIPHLKTTLGADAAADAMFFDQRGTRFHTDLWMLEAQGLMKDGCAVLADNVLKPGAPHFLWYLQHSLKYELTVVSLREFAADRIEDWMALGIYKASVGDCIVPAPKSLDRVAFLTDKARARSCNADGPCEVDEDAWARHAQEIRKAYDELQIRPRIVHVLQSTRGHHKPFVDWSGSFGKTESEFECHCTCGLAREPFCLGFKHLSFAFLDRACGLRTQRDAGQREPWCALMLGQAGATGTPPFIIDAAWVWSLRSEMLSRLFVADASGGWRASQDTPHRH